MHRMPFGIASGRSPREWFPVLVPVFALVLAAAAGADVVVKEKSVSEGLGGFGNGTSTQTRVVSGDKSRSDEEFTYTGRFKSLAGGGKPRSSVSITRIDKEVLWTLDPEQKQYQEMSFAEMRKTLLEAPEAEREQAPQPEAKDAEMTFTVDVKKTGAKETINGFPAEQVIITCTGTPKSGGKEEKSGAVKLVMDQWLTQDAPGAAEMEAFGRQFAEKLGLDPGLSKVSGMARAMYGEGMKELGANLKDLKGFAVRSTFTIETSPETAAEMEKTAEEREKAAQQAKADREKARQEEAKEDQQQDQQDAKDIGSSVLSSPGSATSKIGGLLGRKAARTAQKQADEQAEKKAEEKASSDKKAAKGPLFKVVTEVLSITTSPAPAGSFDVPAGYKLQKTNEGR
jgi:hypothetical protein